MLSLRMEQRLASSAVADRLDELARRVSGVGRGTAATILARVVDVGTTYVFYAVIARSISVSDFGQLMVGFMVFTTAASVCRFGLDQALLTVRASGGVNRLTMTIAAALSIAVAVAAGGVLTVAPVPTFALWLAAALPLVTLGQLVIGALRARGDVAWAAVAEGIVQPCAACALAFVAKEFMPNAAGFSIALLLSWAMMLPFAMRLDWRGAAFGRLESSVFLRTARSMLGVGIIRQAVTSADILLVGLLATSAEVGRYAVAQKIATVFVLLHGAVIASATPFMRSLVDDRRLFDDYSHFVTRWMLSASLPLLVVTIGAPSVVLSLFGQEYAAASGVPLVVLSIAGVVLLLTGPAGSILLVSGKSARLFRVAAAGAVALIVSVACFAHYGAAAAAIGVLIGRVTARGMLIRSTRHVVDRPPFDVPLGIIAGGALASVLLTRLATPSIGAIPAAIAGCAVALTIAIVVLVRSGDFGIVASEFRATEGS